MLNFKKLLLSTAISFILLWLFSGVAYAAESTNQNAVITGNIVNLRENADTSSKVLSKLPKGTIVSVLKTDDKWYNVNYDNTVGWVSKEFIALKEANLGSGYITTEILNLRSKPDTSSEIISKLKQNNKVTLVERSSNWYKVKTSSGDIGWAASEFVTIRKPSISRGDEINRDEDTDDSVVNSSEGDSVVDSSVIQQLISNSKRFIGSDYVYGGDTPKDGFDCSGFTKYIFAKEGINLERTAADQASQGTKVLKSSLKPGDLLFFDTNGGHNHINHVGIYIGSGRFIHASSPRTGVVITNLSDEYYQRAYMRARRIVNQ